MFLLFFSFFFTRKEKKKKGKKKKKKKEEKKKSNAEKANNTKVDKKLLLGCKRSKGKHTESLKKGCAVSQSGGQNIIEHMESG